MDGVPALDREIFKWSNTVRRDPGILIPFLEEKIKKFVPGTKKMEIAPNSFLVFTEGIPAFEEAIEALKQQKPVPEMKWSFDITKASQDHTEQTGPAGEYGHIGIDNSQPHERIQRYFACSRTGENIAYGISDAKEIITQLIVDDGVPSRGHRKNIFGEKWEYFGCFTGTHKVMEKMTTLNYAQSKGTADIQFRKIADLAKAEIQEPEGWIKQSTEMATEEADDGTVRIIVKKTFTFRDGSKKVSHIIRPME